ncbi:hypothetical protein DFH06DRAFT_951418, partial [Mycena polygramma]
VGCAAQSPDYLTFGFTDTVDDCAALCDTVETCVSFNLYHDVNGKDGSDLLTCALFGSYVTPDQATNCGGQVQPDGTIDELTDSDAFCK